MGMREGPTRSYKIRQQLDYPVIDTDGHYVELGPALADFVSKHAGKSVYERYNAIREGGRRYFDGSATPDERRRRGERRYPFWWTHPTKNTLDRATSLLPKLLAERLDDFGIDFSILYPSQGLHFSHQSEEDVRRGLCRAINAYNAEYYGEFSDRMTPAALIPMHSPAEAIDELEHAVKGLGLKAVLFPSYVRRPPEAIAKSHPDLAHAAATLDFYGLDSEHNYDPVWAKCVELGVAPSFHSTGMGLGIRRSYSNFMYNHVGHFASVADGLCKALFMGGVTRRFPDLKFAFLEAGVGWACMLYSDMIGHWKKRNPESLVYLDPSQLDHGKLQDLIAKYGNDAVRGKLPEIMAWQTNANTRPKEDDWAATGIKRAEDFRGLFEPNFYFGCEADDPMNALAFYTKSNPFGAQLRCVMGSDIGHWDVTDMTEILEEAHELVDDNLITPENLRAFLFENAVSLHAGSNPKFFKGTRCEAAVERELSAMKNKETLKD